MFTFDKKTFIKHFVASTSKKIDAEILVNLFETIFDKFNELEKEDDRLYNDVRGIDD